MSLASNSATVASMDAGVEPPWMGLRRVAELLARLMSITDPRPIFLLKDSQLLVLAALNKALLIDTVPLHSI